MECTSLDITKHDVDHKICVYMYMVHFVPVCRYNIAIMYMSVTLQLYKIPA